MAERYAADPPGERPAVPLDELVAVHHRRSGQTHLLIEPAPALLVALDGGPADLEALLERLAATHQLEGAGVREALQARLAELEAIGLVFRA